MTRQDEFETVMYMQAKLNSRALLEQVFPEFVGLFHNLCNNVMKVLERCMEKTQECPRAHLYMCR
ncbi:hypothetical protein J27TS7_24400 [Paenibacillus dendritiformis]|nr:hypothetical protein J27TS7_24400 [Paenibacillus dendritiformis]